MTNGGIHRRCPSRTAAAASEVRPKAAAAGAIMPFLIRKGSVKGGSNSECPAVLAFLRVEALVGD